MPETNRRQQLEEIFSRMLDEAQAIDPELKHVEIDLDYRQSRIMNARVCITPPLHLDKIPGAYKKSTEEGIVIALDPSMVNEDL